MGTKNKYQEHYFAGGMKRDKINNLEDPKTYFFGLNGRLYSKNGSLAFSSIEGTKQVFNDNRIVKYLGYAAFKDELILFIKANAYLNRETEDDFDIDHNDVTKDNTLVFPDTSDVDTSAPIDFSDLYELVSDGFYGDICDSSDYTDTGYLSIKDAVLSIRKENGVFIGKYLWAGNMNWSIDSKICTVGLHENNSFKRIYFTDYLNSFRVINILNGKIENLNAAQFNVFQQFSLSQPLISEVTDGGSLQTGVNFYSYRLISNDGQRTVFSDLSERVLIYPGTTGQDIRGGDIKENAGKKVKIKIINSNTKIYDKIEVVAIIYEAEGSPTSIKSIGVQDLKNINYFYHSGTEASYDLNITLSDLTENNAGWRFCSDIKTKKNKLIASGLRNTPLPFSLVDIEKDFYLKSFSKTGSTFTESFINPDPTNFRFIPKNGIIGNYKKEKIYIKNIKAFGSFIFTLNYNDLKFTKEFNKPNVYNEVLDEIWEFINIHKESYPEFNFSFFDEKLIISNSGLSFNLENLLFEFSTDEVTIDSYFDYNFENTPITGDLIHGYQSFGFTGGNGIRITFKPEFDDIMTKAGAFMSMNDDWIEREVYDRPNKFIPVQTYQETVLQPALANSYTFNRQNLFDLKEKKFKRGLFKGEIYRLGLQLERSGEKNFIIPLGDIMVPSLGEDVLCLDVQEISVWENSRKNDNVLQAILTHLLVDVRLNCDLKKTFSSIKIVYVERTLENRTILCQGISAPLVRYNEFSGTSVLLNSNVANKWQLPFMGGPGIDCHGVYDYETYGENIAGIVGERARTIVHKKLMYFDSPEILFDRIPSGSLNTAKIQIVAKVYGDHNGGLYLSHGRPSELNAQTFSQKIYSTIPINGRNAITAIDFPNSHGLVGEGATLPNWVNVTVFSETSTIKNKSEFTISKSKIIAKGEILSGSYLDLAYEISNNALTLFNPVIFYNVWDRYPDVKRGNTNFEGWNSNRHCVGSRTVFIKTTEDVFNQAFFEGLDMGCPDENMGSSFVTDAAFIKHAVINIVKDNQDTIYGGRSELAYSRNVYIPMSKTIAIEPDVIQTMRFGVSGDTYCSMFFNNKTQYAEYPEQRIHMNHAGGGPDGEDSDKDYDGASLRTAAWAYGVILESTVDISLARGLKFYQNSGAIDMKKTTDKINEVYFQEGILKKYIPKPLNFKDDPDLLHVVAVSETKVIGSPIDNWTDFKANNFYELEKDKGGVFNLGKKLDDIYAIQEFQESRLLLNERNASMSSTDGNIMFKTGEGNGIDGHQVISDFGTSIRRSVTEISASTKESSGFYFFDERKKELIKNGEGILEKQELAYFINDFLKNNPVIDVEGYYDSVNKETVIRCRSESIPVKQLEQMRYVIPEEEPIPYITFSFNEAMQVMNGFFEYNNDQYFVWNEDVFTPRLNSSIIEKLNEAMHLKLFSEDKYLKIGVVTNISANRIKVFHNFMANINIDYPIEKITINTSSGQNRVILGNNKNYKIKETLHLTPLKNVDDWADLRGEWMELMIEIKNLKNKKIDIFSITNFVRESTI